MLTGSLDPVSNKADWIETFEITDADTDEAVDITDATEIAVEIWQRGCSHARLSAKLTEDTIAHVETGVFQWTFTDDQMSTLCAGTYDVKCRITKDDIVTQLIIGTLPVLDG